MFYSDNNYQTTALRFTKSLGVSQLMRQITILIALLTTLVADNLAFSAPRASIQQVTAGGSHTCALNDSGGVKCWGNNSSGQLGNGTTTDSNVPVDVLGLSIGVTAISAGGIHSCALITDGRVKCWGSNNFGQLGDGSNKDRSIPVDVAGLGGNATKIAIGGEHSCALIDTGAVKCWGRNNSGQLGDGTASPRSVPADVSGLTGVTAIAAGFNHTCAVTSGGGVSCWGQNLGGPLGDGTTTTRLVPVEVSGLVSGVTAIAAGFGHTCAVTGTGGVLCWGLNESGQIGDGTRTTRLTSTEVLELDGVTAISAGTIHTCALDGEIIACWGANIFGQLGDATTADKLAPAYLLELNTSITAITAGGNHNCVLTTQGSVKCWGNNQSGQLGNGTTTDQATPVDVLGLNIEPSAIAAGGSHTCLRMGTKFKCWGSNNSGQLGDGTTIDRLAPVDPADSVEDILAIATGGSHACELTSKSSVKCWGSNRHGQLGDGSNIDRFASVGVNELTANVAVISTGANHSCALTNTGGVKCWGSNVNGQLGDGSNNDRTVPVDVTDLTAGVTAISAGANHSCALNGKGGVKCWGSNRYGQLGDGTTIDSLTQIGPANLDNDIVAMATGGSHTCALSGKGALKCWGNNSAGQLGDGTTIGRLTPVDVLTISERIVGVATGENHTCALTDVGAIKCWGSNTSGQIGDGTSLNRLTPTDVSAIGSEVIGIAVGENHTCALTQENGVKCWGSNTSGQLGDGTSTDRYVPTALPAISQRIDFNVLETQLPYAETIVVNATASSGLPVVLDSLTASTCSVTGENLVTVVGQAGELCVLRAQQLGNGSYFPAAPEVRTLQVRPATQTIIFATLPDRAIANGEFLIRADGGASGLPVTFASQTPGMCTTSGTNGATVTLIAAGRCTIRASQSGNNNFTNASDVDQSFSVTRTPDDDSNTDWWRWRGGSGGCTINSSDSIDWSFAILLLLGLGLRLRYRIIDSRD